MMAMSLGAGYAQSVTLSAPSDFALPVPIDAEGHLFRLDEFGRLHVLASIDGQGPFDMLLDTGAARTTINRAVVYRLGLKPLPWRTSRVRTATGTVISQLYRLGGVTALGRRLALGTVPALGDSVAEERFGILGVDLLRGLKGKVCSSSMIRTLFWRQAGRFMMGVRLVGVPWHLM